MSKELIQELNRKEEQLMDAHPEWGDTEPRNEAIMQLLERKAAALSDDDLQAALAKFGVDSVDESFMLPAYLLVELDERLRAVAT